MVVDVACKIIVCGGKIEIFRENEIEFWLSLMKQLVRKRTKDNKGIKFRFGGGNPTLGTFWI